MIRILARRLIKSLGVFVKRGQLLHKQLRLRFPLSADFEVDHFDKFLRVHDPSGASISIASSKRLVLYSRGVNHRIRTLADEYLLREIDWKRNSLLIDVGANIGELGIWAAAEGVQYFGFEPDVNVWPALVENVGAGNAEMVALSDESKPKRFYIATDSADSSLHRPAGFMDEAPSVRLETRTLDSFLDRLAVEGRDLVVLKVEAEGHEPEVLKGALNFLRFVDYVCVDAGAERNGKTTVAEVTNLLSAQAFIMLDKHPRRDTFVYGKVFDL